MPANLSTLFCPKSIAVVGASRDSKKVGAIVLKNIQESNYKGTLYPVNPNTEALGNLKCYNSIANIPETPDLAILAIPSLGIVNILNECGKKGIQNVVVFAAGFKESGEEGEKLEQELIEVAKKYNINLLGPNCLGFVNNNCNLNATFGMVKNQTGNLSFISQSGAIAASIFDWSSSINLGFSDFITLGNKAVINETHVLEYLENKHVPEQNQEGLSTLKPIGMYLESISNGEEFLKITSRLSKQCPLFILKPGKSLEAKNAMHSHTGAIAGENAVLEELLKQSGVIKCETLEDFFDLAKAFSLEEVPKGPNVAVISNAGGPAVITTDSIKEQGLSLAQFDENTKKQLSDVLPRASNIVNPVDVLGDALSERYAKALEIILQLENVDSLVVILTPQIMTQINETAEIISQLSSKYKKPIFASFIGGTLINNGEQILNQHKIPVFRFPERAIYALGKMWKFKQNQVQKIDSLVESPEITLDQEQTGIRGIIQKAINESYTSLDNVDSSKIISSVGVPAPATKHVENIDQAKEFAMQNGWPVVLKLSIPGLLHKKEVGGVIVDIMNEKELDDSFHKMTRKVEELNTQNKQNVKIQIQKGIQRGVQVIIGIKKDSTFGSVLLFGAGGSYAQLINDKNIHKLPINITEARKLVEKSKAYTFLKGTGGEPPYALDKLYEVIVRVGKLAVMAPELAEVEINPLIVTLNDVWAVDTKVIMKKSDAQKPKVAAKLLVAKTIENKVLASKFWQSKFEPELPFIFHPGQYISVKVDKNAVRAYSIATSTGEKEFELLVDIRPGGPGSKFFENLKPNDKITFLGPFGVFTFNNTDNAEELLFLATGSGISAVRCMIDKALYEQNCTKPITLYFGLTYNYEIFWQDHFEELANKYSNFKYKIAIDKPDENWTGAKGFITELVRGDYANAQNCAAYLCGHRAMISDATDLLIKNGCPKERIYTERFI
ncbi:hypothetical protein COV24_02775 [candidate division WWE3 bacterium CG10_big_fil_rev_8_21_14_0_10_32_10]|uniref:Uncharacterized protein n=1 Tax=candidate division WWE3 bacterium CG10_big_fil_rev_8_21_14_0_10_32_10 TaxID=1975090 RepID=A0A2H0RAF6_UNCKA|nr:MAG: hypothetical protein COV24_02775 [candidate division WWE3 bacterium CG10_big_fil_rev_8_21_14_0_10_32_10]